MNFEGLDLGNKKKKKHKKVEKKDEKKDEKQDEGAVPLPEGGLDLTKTGGDDTKKEEKKPAGSAPTMTFDTVDVAGKTADRQKLDAAANEFQQRAATRRRRSRPTT